MPPNHTSDEARYQRLMALAPGPASAVPDLLSYLGDPSWRVRKAAVLALDRFRDDPRLSPSLVAGLASDDNAGLRNACMQALCGMGASATGELARALESPDPGQRKFVAEVLGVIGTPQARDALIAHLADRDMNVAGAISEALGQIGGAEVVTLLKERLKQTSDLMQRVYGLDALVRTGARLPFEELSPWLGDPALKRQVLALLGLSGDVRAVLPLVEGLRAPAQQTRVVAVQGLAALADALSGENQSALGRALDVHAGWEQTLTDLLATEDDALAAAVAKVMAASGRVDLAPSILAAVSCRTTVALGADLVLAMGEEVVAPLLAAFDTADVETRVLTLEVLESLGDASVVAPLLEIAQGPDNRSAEAALRVIGKLGGLEVVRPLMERARDRDNELAHAAAMATAAIGRRHRDAVATLVLAALSAGDERPVWPIVLGVIGRDEDCAVIARLAHHRDAAVRTAALEAAVTYGSDFPESIAIFVLADEQPRVRAAAARVLGAYRSEAALEALLAAARDVDPWVSAQAMRSLGSIGGARVVPTLMDAAASSSSPIAIAALQSLFRVNPPDIGRAITRGLAHADPEVAREAVAAAMRLSGEEVQRLLVQCLQHRAWSVRRAAAEQIANRGLRLPPEVIRQRLVVEPEPLVQESLERLLGPRA